MKNSLLAVCTLLIASGCRELPYSPQVPPLARAGQTVILDGFDGSLNAYVDLQGHRVGRYFNFTPYDSLTISFSAERSAGGSGPVPLKLKVGPAYYLNGSLTGPKQDFAFYVPVHDLAKPGFAALTFFVADTSSILLLTNLRVIGWYTY